MSIQGAELTEFGEFGEFEGEGEGEFEGEFGEFEGEGEGEGEQFLGDILGSVIGGEMESPLSESEEIELASELLELGSEQELEQFLGNLFKGVSRAVGGFIKSPIGKALGGVLKNVAKRALPVVGGALGSMVAPGIGTALGSKLGSMAGGLFEVELEAMPAEVAEFEVARRYVNLAAAAARNAALARPSERVNPQTVARAAVAAAARDHAPGVYRLMMRTLGGPEIPRRPMAPGLGRPARPSLGRPAMPGRPAYRGSAGRRMGGYQPRRLAPMRARGYGMPSGSGSRRRPGPRSWSYGGPRRYGYGYGGWSGPSAWDEPSDEPWTGGDDGLSGDGFQASGRWVRRGRQIILIGV
jgi:uncharacterized protein (DUF697 family)